MKIYTKTGDDGSTGLFYGGRVAKHDVGPEAYGTVDEVVAALGVARAHAAAGGDEKAARRLLACQRDLFVVGAELATAVENRRKLEPGVSLATTEMVDRLEREIDATVAATGLPTEFVVPGGNAPAATLDVARTVARRAERRAVAWAAQLGIEDSAVVPYLNRLADYLYVLARAAEGEWTPSRDKEEQ